MSAALAFPLTVTALQARIADPLRLRVDRPASREDVERAARAGGRMRPAAVLVPLVLHPEPTVLLTLRSADLKAHAGQVAFPGGRLEAGEDAVTAALREAEEEIGIHSSLPEIVGALPPLLTGTGYLVTPVVALLRPPFALQLDPGEVAETFEYPLVHVTDPAKPERRSREFRDETREFWVWPHERHYIWGATASVLVTLASVLRED